jgi:hypothetical protein
MDEDARGKIISTGLGPIHVELQFLLRRLAISDVQLGFQRIRYFGRKQFALRLLLGRGLRKRNVNEREQCKQEESETNHESGKTAPASARLQCTLARRNRSLAESAACPSVRRLNV